MNAYVVLSFYLRLKHKVMLKEHKSLFFKKNQHFEELRHQKHKLKNSLLKEYRNENNLIVITGC